MKRNYSLIAKQFGSYALKIVNFKKGTDRDIAIILDVGVPSAFSVAAWDACFGSSGLSGPMAVLGLGLMIGASSFRLSTNAEQFDKEIAAKYGSSLNVVKYKYELIFGTLATCLDILGPALMANTFGIRSSIAQTVSGLIGSVFAFAGAGATYVTVHSVRKKLADGPRPG